MGRRNAALREERQQDYFDWILCAVSESGGGLSREKLHALLARELTHHGNTAWHADRMVAAMIRGKSLVRKKRLLYLCSTPGAQQSR